MLPKSVGCLKDNGSHRERRKILNTLFTKKEIDRLNPLIGSKSQYFFDRIFRDCEKESGKVIFDAHHKIQALASDIIMEFAYGTSYKQVNPH
jgi:cytochrome P450